MIVDVQKAGIFRHSVLAQMMNRAFGEQSQGVQSGVTTSGKGARLHLLVDSGQNQAKANAILDNYDTLTVQTDKLEINDDDVDTATITCATIDPDMDWIAMLDGEVYATGTVSAVAGVVTLTLHSAVAGTFEVWIMRRTGTYASGHVTIGAV